MILKSLKLSNIRSYIDDEIRFPEGSVLLSGDIGAGKSTILMAIEFALFGIMRAEFSGTALLRNGKNSGYVELNFSIEGKEVTIKRFLKRQKDYVKQEAGSIIINGIQQDLTPQELKARVLSLIGYPDDVLGLAKSLIFRYTVYTPQEEMKRIVFDDPQERLNSLRKIFGIDKYKTIVSNAEIIARKMGEERRFLSERIADLDDKIRQRERYSNELKTIKEKSETLAPGIKRARESLEAKKQDAIEQEKRFNEYIQINNDLQIMVVKLSEKEIQKKKLENELSSVKKEIEILEKKSRELEVLIPLDGLEQGLEEDEKNYLEKISRLNTLKSRETDMLGIVNELDGEINVLERRIKENVSKKEKIEEMKKLVAEKEGFEKKLDSVREILAKIKEGVAEKESLRRASMELKDKILIADKCPLCCQPIFSGQKSFIKEEQEKLLARLGSEIEEFTKKKSSTERDLDEISRKKKELFEAEKTIRGLEGELSDREFLAKSHSEKLGRLNDVKKQLEEISSKIREMQGIEKIHEQIKGKKEILKKARDLELNKKLLGERIEIKNKIEKETAEIGSAIMDVNIAEKQLRLKLDGFRNCEAAMANARKEVEQLQETLKNLEMQQLSAEKDIENISKLVKTIDEEIRAKIETRGYVQKLSEKQLWLKEKFSSFVRMVESHIMQKLHEEFDSYFRQWVSILLEDESVNARLEEDFTPKVEQNGFEMDIADLSGGEKTSFALAYRLALNKVINDVLSAIKTKDLLILDEPTDGFSSEQLDKVRDVLEQLDIAQVILVSHEAKLESFVRSIIRIDKNHHVSRVLA